MSNDNFLPDDYEVPQNASNYLRLKSAETRFRIMSKPVIGWIDWDSEKKAHRYQMAEKPKTSFDTSKPIKHFWAMVIFDYSDNNIKIFEITQSGIQKDIKALAQDPDWGDPKGYDIKIKKEGEKMETKYTVTACPHKPITSEMEQAFDDKPVMLKSLFEMGADPFAAF
jgi:hypothetical protein